MLNKTAILVDVDLTVVDSGWPWLAWMEQVYGVIADENAMNWDWENYGKYQYNLSEYFPEPCTTQLPPYDFWEDPFLYDRLKPRPWCVEALKALYDAGHPIRFVSYCKKGHFSSKARFLKNHFPFMDLEKGTDGCGFYATKVKSGVAGGVIIDDRNNFLNQFPDDVLKIKFATEFTQDEKPRVQYDFESKDWYDIQEFLLETL